MRVLMILLCCLLCGCAHGLEPDAITYSFADGQSEPHSQFNKYQFGVSITYKFKHSGDKNTAHGVGVPKPPLAEMESN